MEEPTTTIFYAEDEEWTELQVDDKEVEEHDEKRTLGTMMLECRCVNLQFHNPNKDRQSTTYVF